jgi:tetratricopeptide (TPR) repeat protein
LRPWLVLAAVVRPDRWDDVERRFRSILNADPGGPHADGAAFMLGEIHAERYRFFRDRREIDRAVRAYEHVIEQYPQSAFADDALVRLADILYYNLDDTRGALALYRRVVERYPASDKASRARIRTVAIEQRHPEYGGAVARAAPERRWEKPLSSPGAVVDGGAQRVRSSLPGAPVDEAPPTDEAALAAPRPAAAAPAVEAARAPETEPEDETLHPLLQEGPIPLRRPSDDLPPLRALRPRS